MTATAHMVMWKLDGATAQARCARAQNLVPAFAALRGKVPGLLRLEVGANQIDAADAFDMALYMVFESRRELEAYKTHPDHLRIKAVMASQRVARSEAEFDLANP